MLIFSVGELLSELVTLLKKSGAKYTILYASQPYGLLESPSNLPLGRYLAEKTNTTKPGRGKCDGECLVKSTLLEGSFVVSCPMDCFFYWLLSFCHVDLSL